MTLTPEQRVERGQMDVDVSKGRDQQHPEPPPQAPKDLFTGRGGYRLELDPDRGWVWKRTAA